MDFSEKVVLVTGGSRGIGAATVKAITSSGGSVVVHYGSNQEAAEKLVAEIGHEKCHLVRADLSKADLRVPSRTIT
jgi:3-oxoacyl-[acyl-carrier protein] reductase